MGLLRRLAHLLDHALSRDLVSDRGAGWLGAGIFVACALFAPATVSERVGLAVLALICLALFHVDSRPVRAAGRGLRTAFRPLGWLLAKAPAPPWWLVAGTFLGIGVFWLALALFQRDDDVGARFVHAVLGLLYFAIARSSFRQRSASAEPH